MPNLSQKPTLISATAETTISGASAISIYSQSGTTTVTGEGSFTLAQGVGVTFEADGNLIGDITVTPSSGATALVTYFK
jgi:hypothetical protein